MGPPQTSVQANRYIPYRTFKFQVFIDDSPVAGISKMTALRKTTEAVSWHFSDTPSHERKLPRQFPLRV